MSLSNDQLTSLIETLQTLVANLQLALANVPTKNQMNALLNIREAEITDLQNRVTTLEAEVAALINPT